MAFPVIDRLKHPRHQYEAFESLSILVGPRHIAKGTLRIIDDQGAYDVAHGRSAAPAPATRLNFQRRFRPTAQAILPSASSSASHLPINISTTASNSIKNDMQDGKPRVHNWMVHETPVERNPSDNNAYTLSRIGPHNIVIASLPAGIYGESPAATVAAQMLSTFPSIRIGLLVGIGGGIPSEQHDIRLGDVVVSRPEKDVGAVVQFDRGKRLGHGRFIRTGSLNKPPSVLLNALGELEADHELGESKMLSYMEEMTEKYPKMRTEYSYQGKANDVLFKSGYEHPEDRPTCNECDHEQIAHRPERNPNPLTYFGIIASSNQVVKDSVPRDRLGRELGAICFEMEAAGLMDNFPCIVVRGISDYADSHKNKQWQRYAAATAAAYAKELLHKIPPRQLSLGPPAAQILHEKLLETHNEVLTVREDIQTIGRRLHIDTLPIAVGAAFDSYGDEPSPHCHPDTRLDLRQEISEWSRGSSEKTVFWLNGMAGTGKSTIARTVARSFQGEGRLGASFFFKRGEGGRSNASRFFTTIAAQIASSIPASGSLIEEEIRKNPHIADKRLADQFHSLFVRPLKALTLQASPPRIVVVDALDECDEVNHLGTIIHFLSSADVREAGLKVFLTSRPETPIRIGFKQLAGETHRSVVLHEVAQNTIQDDIRVVLEKELGEIVEDYNAVAVSADTRLPLKWPGSTAIFRLVEISCPLFISAATICRFLRDFRFHPNSQLATLLEFQGAANHATALHLTYLPILDRILVDGLTKRQHEDLITRFRVVIGSIIVIAEPLSIGHLAWLLDIAKHEVQSMLEPLHAVLHIPRDDSPVRLFHTSFRDFLVERIPENTTFHIDSPSAHRLLFTQCLHCMYRTLKPRGLYRNICGLGFSEDLDEFPEEDTLSRHIPKDLQYACLYWVHPLKQARLVVQDGDEVHRFLEIHLLHWIEAVSLLQKASVILQSIDTLSTLVDHVGIYLIAEGRPTDTMLSQTRSVKMPSQLAKLLKTLSVKSNKPTDETRLAKFLDDAERFIRSNHATLQRAPSLIYPALALAPRSSIVRHKFQNYYPDWVSQAPNVPCSWDKVELVLDGGSSVWALSHNGSQIAMNDEVFDAVSGHVTGSLAESIVNSGNALAAEKIRGKRICMDFASDDDIIMMMDTGYLITWHFSNKELSVRHSGFESIQEVVVSQAGKRLAFLAVASKQDLQGDEGQYERSHPKASRDWSFRCLTIRFDSLSYYARPDHWNDSKRLALSTDGNTAAWAYEAHDSHRVQVVDLTERRPRRSRVLEFYSNIDSLALSLDGSRLAISFWMDSKDDWSTIQIIDVDTARLNCTIDVSIAESLTHMAFTGGSDIIIVHAPYGQVRLYNAITSYKERSESLSPRRMMVSPDGLRIATMSENMRYTQIWKTATIGKVTKNSFLTSKYLYNVKPFVVLLHDGSSAATLPLNQDHFVIWDPADRRLMYKVKTRATPAVVVFSDDSMAFAAASGKHMELDESGGSDDQDMEVEVPNSEEEERGSCDDTPQHQPLCFDDVHKTDKN
ncbi:uncharacterized protein DSM5745_07572 [Aspergillus mulundensis]|uniref:NACHT domain-containing protein n=1 Tax=Aspergillus mulundensis TaxID=1810919 RepID=A0A3D8REI8_9EURO|nr:hypothetical protein DSM5745_07572 [Aspergillus mulundensis]RDW72400.1 hypothetical protein DSM5745_07572 [Aspergillus mulundensis]